MPSSDYWSKVIPPVRKAIEGFDRPNELYMIVKDRQRVFFGYLAQCGRNLVDFEGGLIFKYEVLPMENYMRQGFNFNSPSEML